MAWVRHGGASARKRDAGLANRRDDVDLVGMEVVRRDWTDLAKDVQRELYARLFAGESGHRGGVIAYIVTLAGPELVDALTSEPDREHYLDKQVRPVAEPVLTALGLDFDRVVGDDRQDTLF